MPTPSVRPLPPPQCSRINLSELKAKMARRLGPDRAHQYFDHLSKFLAQKISKPQFSKFCIANLSRKNIPLHNQLICSILKNACQGRTPLPTANEIMPSKSIQFSGKHVLEKEEGLQNQSPNGEMLLLSPCKARSSILDQRVKDFLIPFQNNGTSDVGRHQNALHVEDGISLRHQNLSFEPHDMKTMINKKHEGVAKGQLTKRPRTERLPSDDKKTGATDPGFHSKPLWAPLGIPFCPVSVGGARRLLPLSSSASIGCSDTGELCDTEVLRCRMRKIAEIQGLGYVSVESANMLNSAVDVYLKQLIQSCVELVNSRSDCDPAKLALDKRLIRVKQVNGVWPSCRSPPDLINEPRNCPVVKMEDFRVALELNPQQLGEDWPLLLEKICLSSFKE